MAALLLPWGGVAAAEDVADHPARGAAMRAVEAGDWQEAVAHLKRALADHPSEPVLLADLVRITAEDPAVQRFWAHQYVASIMDERGSVRVPRDMRDVLPDDERLKSLAKARAKAATALVRAATRARGTGSVFTVLAYRRLFDRIAAGAPAVVAAHAASFDAAVDRTAPSTRDVLKVLESHARGTPATPEEALQRVALGRALVGMAAQAAQELTGSPPRAAEKLRSLGEAAIRGAAEALAGLQIEPLTVEELEAMDEEAIEAFNAVHTHAATPGRAVTPEGRYEIVTACGHGTLLACAKHVERLHGWLAAWYGADPFEDTPGLIRIVAESADLESENAPFWWAGGFQRGAITTVQFNLSQPLSMARGLVHELTHRFDGVAYPGLPAWIAEGRAVGTAVAFLDLDAEGLDEYVGDVGRIVEAWSGKYGSEHGLRELLSGEIEDYRDNYTAGHGLWVYLHTWRDGDRYVYRDALQRYLEGFRSGAPGAVSHFEEHLCDGQGGRPAGLAEMGSRLRTFLDAFHIGEGRPEWVQGYFRRERSPGRRS